MSDALMASLVEPCELSPAALPWPASWTVRREPCLAMSAAERCEALQALGGEQPHYWVLHQGPVAPGAERQSLVNLDSALALSSALQQQFASNDRPQLMIQRLPRLRAAGVLFSRHPRRPDLDHIVVEGAAADGEQQRLILHRDGLLAWAGDNSALLTGLTADFHRLAHQLMAHAEGAYAAEWVFDGEQLWVIQVMTVGTLPMPQEAWSRRAEGGISPQVISPLWYTLIGRWWKAGFWRPLGEQAGWQALHNIEPYRRQHSHLYGNSVFIRALQDWRGVARSGRALPPAWRRPELPVSALPGRWQRVRWWLRARWLHYQLLAVQRRPPSDRWLQLMRLDRIGERLAHLAGQLRCIWLPELPSTHFASLTPAALWRDLAALAEGELSADELLGRHGQLAAGLDPVWPRWAEQGADLNQLFAHLPELSPARRMALRSLTESSEPLLRMQQQLDHTEQQLAAMLRSVLQEMADWLHQKARLKHPDDIFFVYFDELWQLWREAPPANLLARLAERKVRYLTDGHSGPPDWIIDQIGYGTRAFGRETRQPLLRGYPLVPGQVSGRLRRIDSGWQLNQLQPGDLVVLDQCAAGWLPWLSLAGGLLLAHRDPQDPAVALARALSIPTVWGVDDAMHSVVEGDLLTLDADQGWVGG